MFLFYKVKHDIQIFLSRLEAPALTCRAAVAGPPATPCPQPAVAEQGKVKVKSRSIV